MVYHLSARNFAFAILFLESVCFGKFKSLLVHYSTAIPSPVTWLVPKEELCNPSISCWTLRFLLLFQNLQELVMSIYFHHLCLFFVGEKERQLYLIIFPSFHCRVPSISEGPFTLIVLVLRVSVGCSLMRTSTMQDKGKLWFIWKANLIHSMQLSGNLLISELLAVCILGLCSLITVPWLTGHYVSSFILDGGKLSLETGRRQRALKRKEECMEGSNFLYNKRKPL